MKHLISALCVIVLFSTQVLAFTGHKHSEWKGKECVSLELKYENGPWIPPGKPKMAALPFVIAGASFIIPKVIAFFKEKMDEEAKKYMAGYGSQLASTSFFQGRGNTPQHLSNITLTRYAAHEHQPDKARQASTIILGLHREKNGTFTFILEDAKIKYSKCKIHKNEESTYTPAVPTIDLRITIVIQCFWLNAEGIPQTTILGTQVIPLKQVPVRGTYTGEFKGGPSLAPECQVKGNPYQTWFPPFPKTYIDGKGSNDVSYVLKVSVEEFDDFDETVKRYAKFAGGTAEASYLMLKAFLEELSE